MGAKKKDKTHRQSDFMANLLPKNYYQRSPLSPPLCACLFQMTAQNKIKIKSKE